MGGDNSTLLSFYLRQASANTSFCHTQSGADVKQQLFQLLDTDNSGAIDGKEVMVMWKTVNKALKKLANDLKLEKEQRKIEKQTFLGMVQKYDVLGNNNGMLDFDEFSALLDEVCKNIS